MLMPITEGKAEAKVSSYHYISIPRQVYVDLCAYVDHYDTEVSGCGMVERIEHRFKSEDKEEPDTIEIEFAIKEVYLPEKQDNSGASTEIDDECVAKLVDSLLKEGKNTEHLRLHWHSHADMDTFHSGTDEDNYATLSNGDFLVSLVINKAHKFLGRVDYFKPVRVMLNNLGVHMVVDIDEKISKGAEKSMKLLDENTKSRVSTYSYPSMGNWNDWGGDTTLYNSGFDKLDKIDTFDEDMQIADALGIKREEAKHYRDCTSQACHCCAKANVCQDYLYQIDKLPNC